MKRFVKVGLVLLLVQAMLTGLASMGPLGAAEGQVQLPAGVSGDWWARVQEDIRRAEYRVTRQEKTLLPGLSGAYQAPNRAHNLRTYFTPEGVWVVPRTSESPEWRWGLRLIAVGSSGAMQKPEAAALQVNGNRVELSRGQVTEWYVNDERGLEQGFRVQEPPPGSEGATELVLQLCVLGTVAGRVTGDGSAIAFALEGGKTVLCYGELKAFDGAGRELPARFALVHGGLEIRVATERAHYPIRIDPLATTPDWSAESDQAGARLGISVSTAGDVNGDGYSDVIVGAQHYDNGQNFEGAAFVYHGSAYGLSETPDWSAESNQADANFGYSVSTTGDVNGDGYSDVIVGAPGYSNGQTFEGAAFVYHGSASGLSGTANWSAEPNEAGALFGISVSTAGDVNGDGYSDVIVGAPLYDNGQNAEGGAFVYHGSASGLSGTANWSGEPDQANAQFGTSVSTAGDVNGDGYSDVIVGAPLYDNGQADEGAAFVYHGSASGLSGTANWSGESDQADARFGYSVSKAGDVNGDGYSDVIVGAYLYDNGEANEGAAFVYHGSASGLSTLADWSTESNQQGACFGYSVSTAGDVNGDGYSDIIVGAYLYDNGQSNEGAASVYYGSASGPSGSTRVESNCASARFGSSVSTAGDVNADGYSDVIVGASYYSSGETKEGAAFVYHGSASGLNMTPNWTTESDQADAQFGSSVSTAGDVNGDGYSDVIVGAPYYDGSSTDQGRAFLYAGNGGYGLSVRPRQLRTAGSVPISWLGSSDSVTAFRLAMLGRTPYGRGKVKLEWEVKPRGTLFDGTGLGRSASWQDSGTAGHAFSQLIGSLSASTLYHWRLRVLYHPAATPHQAYSRWLTPAFNGAQGVDFRTASDSDGDGLSDALELSTCTNPLDADSDDDGIPDGVEDANHNGLKDSNETNPCKLDTDGDGIQDGTERGYTQSSIGPDTNTSIFQPDLDPSTTTDPLGADSDNDGVKDGDEDKNHNGRVDPGETDPNKRDQGSFYLIPNPSGGAAVIYLE